MDWFFSSSWSSRHFQLKVTFPPKKWHFPQKSDMFPQKSDIFPQKSDIFPQKSDIFHQKSDIFPLYKPIHWTSAIFPNTSRLPPASHVFFPRWGKRSFNQRLGPDRGSLKKTFFFLRTWQAVKLDLYHLVMTNSYGIVSTIKTSGIWWDRMGK